MNTSSIESLISSIILKLDSDIKTKLQVWGKNVQLCIDDELYFVKLSQNLELQKGKLDEDPDFTITSSFKTFTEILNAELNPVEAVVSGEVAIDGSLTAALEFSEIVAEKLKA